MKKVIIPQIRVSQVSDSPEFHNKHLGSLFLTELEKDKMVDEDLIFFDGSEWKCYTSNLNSLLIGEFVAVLSDDLQLKFQFKNELFTLDLSHDDITEYTDSITTADGVVWDINFDNYEPDHFSFRVIPLMGKGETLEVDANAESIEYYVVTNVPTESEESKAVYDVINNTEDPWMGMTLGAIIREFKDGGDSLDTGEVKKLIDIIHAKINLEEGNISRDEYEMFLG